jgi:hypothetical protein
VHVKTASQEMELDAVCQQKELCGSKPNKAVASVKHDPLSSDLPVSLSSVRRPSRSNRAAKNPGIEAQPV